jgi:hypothetical protein
MMDAFPSVQRETARLAEASEGECLDSAAKTSEKMDSIKSRLKLLKKYNLSEEDMAKVLQVDRERLFECLFHRSTTQAANDLAVVTTQELKWESGFEFPLARVGGSKVKLDLMCQPPGRSTRVLGTYDCDVSELLSEPQCTTWQTVELSGSSAILKLKLCWRQLGGVRV